MQLRKWGDHWGVFEDEMPDPELGILIMDFSRQVDEVLLRTNDREKAKRIKQIALSHVYQYQRDRHRPVHVPGMEMRLNSVELTDADSDSLMSFGRVPRQIRVMTEHECDVYLGNAGIVVIQQFLPSVTGIFPRICRSLKRRYGVTATFEIEEGRLGPYRRRVSFRLESDHLFRVWKSATSPTHFNQDSGFCLHITASYHPCMLHAKSVGMINGATDALINKHDFGIHEVYSPTEARLNRGHRSSSSWNDVNHPFYAAGKDLGFEVSITRLNSREGYRLLLQLVCAALNLENTYMEVSGGFCAPMQAKQPPAARESSRGSESEAVWEYNTLVHEGKLEESLVPAWLVSEGWVTPQSPTNVS